MNVVIIGGGLVGSTLAGKLAADGHDVSLVERDPDLARELGASLDVQIVVGNATSPAVLRKTGVAKADLLFACTNSDAENVLVGTIATTLFQVPRVVVRVRDAEYEDTFARLTEGRPGEHVSVNPQAAAVDRILNLLDVPGALDVVSFLDDQLLVAGFLIREGSDLAGLTLAHMNLLFPGTPTLVAAIHRGDTWLIPHGDEEIREDDVAYFVIPRPHLEDILGLIGALEVERRKIVIAGATPMGLAVARRLEAQGRPAVLIEESARRAEDAADALERTLVVRGAATDRGLLEEEGIERVSTFVAVLADHEENLVSGLLAKRLGANRAFCLVDNPALANLIGEVGIDAVISPRLLAVGLALRRVHRGRILAVEALVDEKIEILEAEVVAGSRLAAAELAGVGLPKGVLVAALRRGEELLLPGGDTRIEVGDRLLFVTRVRSAAGLDRFLSP